MNQSCNYALSDSQGDITTCTGAFFCAACPRKRISLLWQPSVTKNMVLLHCILKGSVCLSRVNHRVPHSLIW